MVDPKRSVAFPAAFERVVKNPISVRYVRTTKIFETTRERNAATKHGVFNDGEGNSFVCHGLKDPVLLVRAQELVLKLMLRQQSPQRQPSGGGLESPGRVGNVNPEP
jgi:hypothetical protein